MTKAESSAEELVFDLGLSLPIVPEDVCHELSSESFSVTYQEKHLSSPQLCGISLGDKTGAEILVNSAIANQGRKNFTGAHEIGHVIMHIQTGQQSQFKCTNDDIYGSEGMNQAFEKEANEFASSLLMPKGIIGDTVLHNDLSWQLIQSIHDDCNTSLEATARRIIRISSEACALIIHKDGEMWTPIKSPSFPVYINNTSFPTNLDTSADIIGATLPDTLQECDVSDWLINNEGMPDTILYSSIRNDEYDRVMTLLLIPDIDEDEVNSEWKDPTFK